MLEAHHKLRIWAALLQKSIAKGVKDFSKRFPACQLMEGNLNIKSDHWHNSNWRTLLLYDFMQFNEFVSEIMWM